jgi:glycosyltransferase involved in cell wall biosynthesis
MAKICVITDIFPHDEHKSAGIFVRDHVEILSAQYDVEVIVIRSKKFFSNKPRTYLRDNLPESVNIKEITYLSFPRNFAPNIVFPLLFDNLKKTVNLSTFDLFYIHNILPGGGLIPLLKHHYPNSICVQMVHNSDWRQKWPRFYLKNVLTDIVAKADHVWISGPELGKEMSEAIPKFSDKFKVVYNLVAPLLFNASKTLLKDDASAKLGWNSNDIHILVVANIAHVKGLDVLIEALANVATSSWDFVHILGEIREIEYAESIYKLLEKYHLKDKFIFHKSKSREELVKFYAASDYYVLPSRYEGFNVSMIEAASFRKPAVITHCDGSNLILTDKKRLPSPGSISELQLSLEYAFNTKLTDDIYDTKFLEKYCQPESLLNRISDVI